MSDADLLDKMTKVANEQATRAERLVRENVDLEDGYLTQLEAKDAIIKAQSDAINALKTQLRELGAALCNSAAVALNVSR